MGTISQLLYFLNSVKNTLLFENKEDFLFKIKTDFNFRLKVQKFVFIAKYFGWNHSYEYVFYLRGPYSSELADDYYREDLLFYSPVNINDFDCDSFNQFVFNKSNDYLESVSTILFNKYIENEVSIQKIIEKISILKPHIDSLIISNAYEDIIDKKLVENNAFTMERIDLNLDNQEFHLKNKILFYFNYFKSFNRCNNSIIITGSLEYLSIALKKENLNLVMKKDLLDILDLYVNDIENIYFICNNNPNIFQDMNLNKLENFFDRLQNYISEELNIIPKLDDDEFDVMFYE